MEYSRYVDGIGRVTIPKELRKHLGIVSGDIVYVSLNDKEEIVVRRITHYTKCPKCHRILRDVKYCYNCGTKQEI